MRLFTSSHLSVKINFAVLSYQLASFWLFIRSDPSRHYYLLHVHLSILTFFSKNPHFEFSISTSSHRQWADSTVFFLLWLELDGHNFPFMGWVNTSVWGITKIGRRLKMKSIHKKMCLSAVDKTNKKKCSVPQL